jgi:hypothetical protein
MQYPDITAEVGDTLVFNYMRMHDVRAAPFRRIGRSHALIPSACLTRGRSRCAGVGGAERVGDLLRGLDLEVRDDDLRALLRKAVRGRFADTRATARDQRHLVLQTSSHVEPPPAFSCRNRGG